jgi:glycine cleavage system aminomethyltransferase T
MAIDRNRRRKSGRHDTPLPADYRALLTDVKSRIRAAQLRASLSVNQELIQLYWDIGRLIAHRQQAAYSPTLGHGIALALLSCGRDRHGDCVIAHDPVRGTVMEAKVCNPVFYDPEGARVRG